MAARSMSSSSRVTDLEAALARFVTRLDLARLDPVLVHKARLCLIDGVGASMTLSRAPEARQALRSVGEPGAGLLALVLGSGCRHRAVDAAFVNAVAAAATIRTDTHTASASHPGMVVLPVVLALAQECGAGASDLLCAIVAGYEISIRLGLALVTPELSRKFRPTGLTGAVAAAAAASRLLRLDANMTSVAMALAANTASGLNEWARAGTSEHVFHAGTAARNAIAAVQLARAGASAAPRTLSGPSGLLAAYDATARIASLTDGLGEHFHMCGVVHKLAPACVFAQAPCQAALALMKNEDLDPSTIESVEIGVSEAAARFPGCDFAGPFESPSAAQQSIQFGVASVLHASAIDEALWAEPQALGVNQLAARCAVVVDSAINASYPARLGASVTVRTMHGETSRARVSDAAPMSEHAIEARFAGDAGPRLGATGAARLLEALRALGPAGSEQIVFALLAAPLRPTPAEQTHSMSVV